MNETSNETSRVGGLVVAVVVACMLALGSLLAIGGVLYLRMERRARQAEQAAMERMEELRATADMARAMDQQAEALSRLNQTMQAGDETNSEPVPDQE